MLISPLHSQLCLIPAVSCADPHRLRLLTLVEGMDLNPVFTDITKFRPSGPSGSGGLELFSHTGISLVHGWLADPDSAEYDAVKRSVDYDNSVNLIVEADDLTQGRLVVDEDLVQAGPSTSKLPDSWSDEQRTKVEDGEYRTVNKCIKLSDLPSHSDVNSNVFS